MKKIDSYLYPAILTYEKGYEIAVTFPDFLGCTTSGADEAEALKMAKEALGGHIWCMETDNEELPYPTSLPNVNLEDNEQAILVDIFMPAIRLEKENRSVNRTVTLPAWLNAAALERNVNFSQVLQSALINQIGTKKTP